MPGYSAPIDIFRAAMPRIGGQIPSSLDTGTAEADVFNATYEGVVEDFLTKHSWSFATRRATLTYEGETGDYPQYAYALPADLLTIRKAMLGGLDWDDYELRGGKLLCNLKDTTEIDVLYTWRVTEPDWPADFAKIVVFEMTSILALGILDSRTKAQFWADKAQAQFTKASVRDRRSGGKLAYKPDSSLVRAWNGGAKTRTYTRAET